MRGLARPLAVTVALAAWLAPAAHATDYCVAPNTTCGGTNVATFEDALGTADNNNDADRIFLGAATYTSPMTGYSYNNMFGPLEIIGAGVGQTILTSPFGGTNGVLFFEPDPNGSSIHDLSVHMPQNVPSGFVGLDTHADASSIEVDEQSSQANPHTGIRVNGVSLSNAVVTTGMDIGNNVGVALDDGGEELNDSFITSRRAIVSFGATIRRSVLAGSTGIDASFGVTTMTDSLISISDPSGTGVYVGTGSGADTTLNADGLTIVGPEAGGGATGFYAGNCCDNAQSSHASLADSVIRDFGVALQISDAGTGTANITASYSDYDGSTNIDGGDGTITQSNHITNLGDAKFADAAGGDYHLRFDSPLIDIGEPGMPTSQFDFDNLARLVDGDLDGTATRDIGAFEYQAQAPAAAISGPDTATTGQQVSFSGAGSSDPDPGDVLTFAWTIDGVAAGTASTLDATFTAAGDHTVGLTVTDPRGKTATATKKVVVSAPPGGGGGTTPPPPTAKDTTAPTISSLAVQPKRARRGKRVTFSFQLDEAAAVQVRIERVLPGRKQGRSCRKPSARNRKGKRCTRFARVTTLTATGLKGANSVRFSGRVRGRALAAGRYPATVVATDAAGNASAPKRVSFVVRR
jgi:PKD domain